METAFDYLTQEDKEMIKSYIKYCSGSTREPDVSLDYLFRYWNTNKQKLFNLFGGNLIITKEIECHKSRDELSNTMYYELISQYQTTEKNRPLKVIYQKFVNWVNSINLSNDTTDMCNNRNVIAYLLDCSTLVDNKFNYRRDTVKITTRDGQVVSINPGEKPFKIVKKFNNIYHFWTDEEFEQYRIAHSQVLNTATFKGELCLSIHPLDYMTMSDNVNNWSSCMSWESWGCYRRGTVEMMNSPYVIVAYLKGNKEMPIGSYTWNSKKWRQLFIYGDELITSIKSYPYDSEELTLQVLNWIAELAETNLDNWFDTDTLIHPYSDYDEDEDYGFQFETNAMYNDFGTTTHYAYLRNPQKLDYYLNYSGEEECMCCGEIDVSWCDDDGHNSLVCNNCDGSERCDYCNDRVFDGYMYEVDGEVLCENCICNNCALDVFDGKLHLECNMKEFYVLPDFENPTRNAYRRENRFFATEDNLEKFLEEGCELYIDHTSNTWLDYNYVRTSDLKIEAIGKLIGYDAWGYSISDYRLDYKSY